MLTFSRLIPTTLGATRRSVAPLDIVGLPAYDKLTQEERDLCTEQRVYPEVFVEIKTLMEQECAKHDGLRLADIRYAHCATLLSLPSPTLFFLQILTKFVSEETLVTLFLVIGFSLGKIFHSFILQAAGQN